MDESRYVKTYNIHGDQRQVWRVIRHAIYVSTMISISILSRPFSCWLPKKTLLYIDAVLYIQSVVVAECDTSQQQPADADQYKWFSSAIEFLIG